MEATIGTGVYELPPQLRELRDAIRGIVADKVSPRAEIDAAAEHPGGAPASMRTHAARDGGEWVIGGAKSWTSNATIAEFYVVFAVTDVETRRITAFVVEADRPGCAVGELEHKVDAGMSPITRSSA